MTTLAIGAPLAGVVTALTDVPDPVFAGAVVGHGTAIEPEQGATAVTAVAPCSGTVATIHPHAFVVLDPATQGGVLVHLGIDTVKLHGEGFQLHAAAGDQVEAGAPVITFDPTAVRAAGLSAVCPVVVFSAKAEQITVGTQPGATVRPGDDLLRYTPAP